MRPRRECAGSASLGLLITATNGHPKRNAFLWSPAHSQPGKSGVKQNWQTGVELLCASIGGGFAASARMAGHSDAAGTTSGASRHGT